MDGSTGWTSKCPTNQSFTYMYGGFLLRTVIAMETQLPPPRIESGTIPQSIIVIGGIVLLALAYHFASGSGSGRSLESDRQIVASCWKSIDRKDPGAEERSRLSDVCARMERGLNLKYGSTW